MRWLLLLVLAGCTDFDDVDRNICGNGLLEAGEDCDSNDPSCVRCAVACAIDNDCPSDAYACGVDGFCHAPGGELARPSAPVTFRADSMRVTDIDHDGRGDVVGVSRTSISVRYGDALGALAAADSFVTPAQSGPASFGDLDGDGSLDVTLSTSDGLVTYTSAFGTLSPIDVESPLIDGESGQPTDLIGMYALGPVQIAAFGVLDGVMIMIVVDFADTEGRIAAAAPCVQRLGTIPRASFDLARVDVYRANLETATVRNSVISMTTATGATCVLSINGTSAAGYTITDVTPASVGNQTKRPVLADLDTDADPCPGIVSSDGGPSAIKWWKGRIASGRCTLDATPTTLPALSGAPASAVAIGRIPIVPAIPFVAADGLVTTNGIYGVVLGGGVVPMFQSQRPLARVAHGDFDGDGDIDAVASAETEDDLDIFYRYPEGVELLRFDTASNVTSITVADYDGNGIADLAYTEAAINHQRLFVAYGTVDRHLPPLPVAAFANVATMTPIEFRDSADNLSVADDLFVILPAVGNAKPTSTLLHGSPQRTMLSFLEPRTSDLAERSVVRGAVVGQFAGGDEPDLLVIAAPNPQETIGMRAYRVAGTATGLETAQSAGTIVDGLTDCQVSASGACVQTVEYLAWPRAGTTDAVIAIDRRPGTPRALLVDPGQPAKPLPLVADDLPAGADIQSLHAFDIDGDGSRELIAAFTGSVRICDVDPSGMPTRCEEVKPSSTLSCIDAAPGRIGEPGVVVLCREGTASSLFRVTRQSGALVTTELAQGAALRQLRVDDVTGDGVDDVIAVQGDGIASALVVFPQCTSRDLTACRTEGRSQ